MESPSKRIKPTPPPEPVGAEEADFIPLDNPDDDDDEAEDATQSLASERHGLNTRLAPHPSLPPKPPAQQWRGYLRSAAFQRRHARDRPQSRHALPGHEPWELVWTQGGRRFVHNRQTRESYWRVPPVLEKAIEEFEREDGLRREREENAKWAEEQLVEMRKKMVQSEGSDKNDAKGAGGAEIRARRRRSESLQREDEEAMMAMLAAETERGEEEDARQAAGNVMKLQPVAVQRAPRTESQGNDSDSSYEEVEVTDSEGEEDEDKPDRGPDRASASQPQQQQQPHDNDAPVEFGEDDIAYQLAAMDEDYYGLDPDEYYGEANGEHDHDPNNEDARPPPPHSPSYEEAASIFRAMLDDHRVSPFTPWDKLMADSSPTSIVNDDRYALLPNTRTRKEVWQSWAKDAAARIRDERARQEKQDPRVAYMALLSKCASPKLYWPEFKRKFRKEPAMTDRHLSDKERERMYREFVAKR